MLMRCLRDKLLAFLWRSRNASFVWMATVTKRISASPAEVEAVLADLGLGKRSACISRLVTRKQFR